MKPTDKIEKLVKKYNINVNPKRDEQVLDEILLAQKKGNANQSMTVSTAIDLWRIIMKSRITKFAIAAVVLIAVLIGMNQFGGSIDGASIAWGDIIHEIVVAKTATFDLIIKKDSQVIQQSHITCKAPGLIRQIMPDGAVHIADFKKHKILVLNTKSKKAILRELTEDSTQLAMLDVFGSFQKRLDTMIHFQDETVESLGYRTIGGKDVIGFRIQITEADEVIGWQGKGTFTVWAESSTKLPIRLEFYDEMFGINTVMDKLELNMKLDESIFEIKVPDEYELETIQQKAMNNETSGNFTGIDEKQIIEGFRSWVYLTDGVFPSSMTMDAIKDLDPDATLSMKQVGWGFQVGVSNIDLNYELYSASNDNPISTEELRVIRKKFNAALSNSLNGFIAVFQLPADTNWHYSGSGVTINDIDTPIFRYRPKGSINYRVIYGNLTVEDIAPENLPK